MNNKSNIKIAGKRIMPLWFFLLSVFCLLSINLSAVKDYNVKNIPNVRLVDKNNHVSNPDGILSDTDTRDINIALKSLEDSLGIEVAVVAVESIGNNDARAFATDLFKEWGIGNKKDDNGLLIQLVTEPSQRSVVFETGYGLEGVLPDAICFRLQQQYMIPEMKAGNYSSGMLNGVLAVKEYLLASDYERSIMIDQADEEELPFWLVMIIILAFPLSFVFIVFIAYYIKRRPKICPRCGKKTLVYVRQQTIQKPTYKANGLAVDIYVCKNCGYTENKNIPLARLRKSTAPIIIGGGSSGGSSWGGGSFGGSWGGGRSGGGGSISRF